MGDKDYGDPRNWGKEQWLDAAVCFAMISCELFMMYVIMWVFY